MDVGLAKLIFFDGELRALISKAMPSEIAGLDLAAQWPIASLPQPMRRQSLGVILRLLQRAGFTSDQAVAQQD